MTTVETTASIHVRADELVNGPGDVIYVEDHGPTRRITDRAGSSVETTIRSTTVERIVQRAVTAHRDDPDGYTAVWSAIERGIGGTHA